MKENKMNQKSTKVLCYGEQYPVPRFKFTFRFQIRSQCTVHMI